MESNCCNEQKQVPATHLDLHRQRLSLQRSSVVYTLAVISEAAFPVTRLNTLVCGPRMLQLYIS